MFSSRSSTNKISPAGTPSPSTACRYIAASGFAMPSRCENVWCENSPSAGNRPEHAKLHRIADIGKNSGLDSSPIQPRRPLHHLHVRLRPDAGVRIDQRAENLCIDGLIEVASDALPIGLRAQCSAIIGVSILPIRRLKASLLRVQNMLQLPPRRIFRNIAQHHAIVEQHRADLDLRLICHGYHSMGEQIDQSDMRDFEQVR